MKKVKNLVTISLVGVAVFCCSLVLSTPSESRPEETQESTESSEICLLVAGGDNRQQLDDVEVSAVSSIGNERLGFTGVDGSICLEKELLRERKVHAILFCKNGYFCGAYRLDRLLGGRDFLDFNEQFIVLAPFMLG
jgi:hypothetical protein